MNRRSFMQLLAGLLIFRPKMREKNDGYFYRYNYVVGVDPASPEGDYGAIVVMKYRGINELMSEQVRGRECPRCGIGRDTDGDGDCMFCARLTDDQVEHIYAYGKTLQPMAEECLKRNIGRVAER